MAALVLPLMFGGLMLVGMQQINENTLQGEQRNAQIEIDKQGRHMTIGRTVEGDEVTPRVAEEQFRGLVIYSQVSAINCQLMYWLHAEDPEGNTAGKYIYGTNEPNRLDQDSNYMVKYSLPGRYSGDDNRLFQYLANSNYVPSCVGTSNNVDSHLVDKRVKNLRKGNFLKAGFDIAIGTYLGGAEDLWNWADCNLEPDWAANRGNDMEGRFGKISFESDITFYPGRRSNGKVWSANFLRDVGNCPLDNQDIVGPDFLRGEEWMDYLPHPQRSTPENLNYHTNGNSPPFKEEKSAMMDAIVDAPAVTDIDLSEKDVPGDGEGEGYGYWPKRDVYYVICENAEGSVQTNANHINNGGEAIWGNNNKGVGEYRGFETRTFTFIDVTANKTTCINNVHRESISVHGELYTGGPDCSSFEEASSEDPKTVEYGGSTYECALHRYGWENGDGDLIRYVYEIGWIRDVGGSSGTSDITKTYNFVPSNQRGSVLSDISNGLLFEPGKSDERDYIRYNLPEGNKKVSIEVKFRQRGHVQFDFRDSSDNTVTYTNTDLYGNEHLYIQTPSGYTDTDYDYPVDDVFTIIFERNSGANSWKVENNGEIKWSSSMNMQDPQELVIESWRDPMVEIREVELEY